MDESKPIVSATQRWRPSKRQLFGVVVLLVLVAGGGWTGYYIYHRNQLNNLHAANAPLQQGLESNLNQANNNGNNQLLLQNASQLIAGANDGRFVFSKPQLATIYIERAAAQGDLGHNQDALSDYQTALKLDSGQKLAILEGEVNIYLAMGEKRQSIPLLQQIISLEQGSRAPFASSDAEHYQAIMQSIKGN